MGRVVELRKHKYLIETDYNQGFDLSVVTEKITDFFDIYDYIVGDWAYGKLRLKGFYEVNHKRACGYNNIKYLKKYLSENCAYGCKYFVLKKVDKME